MVDYEDKTRTKTKFGHLRKMYHRQNAMKMSYQMNSMKI